jgi:hypothetical protein
MRKRSSKHPQNSKRAQALTAPLITTAIADHKASWLNRGTAIGRSSAESAPKAITPPTQKAKAITCITSEPMTSECEPLDAA